jgi:uncharacterized membrane protein
MRMKRRSADDLARDLLGKDLAALSDMERDVLERIANRSVSSINETAGDQQATLGQRVADRVAAVGGSWGFIISFAVVLFTWMFINSPLTKSLGIQFDPYPFIFLNLMLSMLAAVQAPVIMMSQNRQGEIDRQTAKHDYEVNLRAEIEIIMLHEKLEHVMGELDQIKIACNVKPKP